MEHVQFGMSHGVDVPPDGGQGKIMSGGIQHEPTVGVRGPVAYLDVADHHQCFAGRCGTVGGDELPQCLQPVTCPVNGVRYDFDDYLVTCKNGPQEKSCVIFFLRAAHAYRLRAPLSVKTNTENF